MNQALTVTSNFIIFNKRALRLAGDLVRAGRAGPVLRGQRFANKQIIRGPALATLSGPVGFFARYSIVFVCLLI